MIPRTFAVALPFESQGRHLVKKGYIGRVAMDAYATDRGEPSGMDAEKPRLYTNTLEIFRYFQRLDLYVAVGH